VNVSVFYKKVHEMVLSRIIVRNLRKVFGPIKKKDGSWKIKTNIELDELIQHRNIINYVKAQRLSWYGHLYRKPCKENT